MVIVSLFFCLFFVNTKAIGEITALDWSKWQDLEPLRLALQTSFTAEANHGHADDHQWIDSDETLGDNSGYYIAVAAAAGSGDITITGFMIEYH